MRTVVLNILVAAAYGLTGWLGLKYPYYGEHVTLLWAPAAIALAAVVLAGPVAAPGIFLGVLSLSFTPTAHPWRESLAIAVGNTLGPLVVGELLVRRYRFRPEFDRVRDAILFVGMGAIGTSLITATSGVVALRLLGRIPSEQVWAAWHGWFGGDAIGILILGPALLTWGAHRDSLPRLRASTAESVLLAAILLGFTASVVAYGDRVPTLPYAYGLLFVWTLLRSTIRGISLATALVSIVLVVATVLGLGPFSVASPSENILQLWVFLAAAGIGTMTTGALVAERDYALHEQLRLRHELDHRVKNTLATVIALAERSSATADADERYVASFVSRLRAIARTHESLARASWQGLGLDDVVKMTVAPFEVEGRGRIAATGSNVELAAVTVGPMTMALHELATNAAKYGAWSRADGHVDVTWTGGNGVPLRLVWRERGGPEVSGSPSPGYGLGLIEGLIVHELGGRVSLAFESGGLVCTIDVPMRDAKAARRGNDFIARIQRAREPRDETPDQSFT